jgi:hypothetical protein
LPSLIDNYELLAIIGSGASGTVWHAYQHDLGRYVAIKELAPALVADHRFLERFRADAKLMVRLDSTHCASVYDFIEESGRAWLVSEYVDGPSLRRILDHTGFLTDEQALGVLKGALIGLGYAHGVGLVHRDVKPDNLLADRHGVTKLTDFGQALFNPGPGAADGIPTGTPGYMSPEQVSGGPVEYRSDTYSAGAMFFEFLTGKPPFRAESAVALMRMHVNDPVPDPRSLNSDIPHGVAEMVMRAMAKDPAARQQTTFEFLDDLQRAAVAGYGENWEQRSSIQGLVASVIAAGGLVRPNRGASAESGPDSAVAAADVEAAWWTNKLVLAGGIAAALVLAGGAFALGSGALGNHRGVAVTLASPSPSSVASPTASTVPSPSPETSPSPTATPPPPTAAPIAGPATVSAATVWFVDCSEPTMACAGAPQNGAAHNNGTNPLLVDCNAKHYLSFYDTYSYSNPGATIPLKTVAWVGKRSDGTTEAASGTPGEAFSANSTSAQHPVAASIAYPDVAIASLAGGGLGYVQFKLTWTNPDGKSASSLSDYFYYTCGMPSPSP